MTVPATETEDPTPPAGDPPAGDPPAGDPPPPNPLETALAAERAERKKLEKALAEANKKNMSEQERAIAEAREQAREEAMAEARAEVRTARVIAIATEMQFHDPSDVVASIDADDPAAIRAALEKVAADKPYLVKQANGGTPPPINQGSRGGPPPKDANAWLRDTLNARRG